MADEEKDEQTEAATPRRRSEAREKGQVPMSQELVAALLLCGWAASFTFAGGGLARALGGQLQQSFEGLRQVGTGELSIPAAAELLGQVGFDASGALFVLLAPLFLFGVLAAYGQIGFQITPKALEADLARLNPIKGMGRLFSARSAVRTGLALGKLTLIFVAMAAAAWTQIEEIVSLSGSDIGPVLAGVGSIALRAVAGALIAILALALCDMAFQRWQHERDLRMSKQQVREEVKSLEGDPHIRARIRRVQRELASRRQMADVPDATVVVTNPTHYAVALRYESPEEGAPGAPKVVAKGVDHVAQRIKELARESHVLCYEDVPLARALHARCEVGDEIPVDLYQAVAEVLAYVFRLQNEMEPVAAP